MQQAKFSVNNIVKRIAKQIQPEKIILFGSRARGKSSPESDIDILIVYAGPKSKREVKLAVHSLFEHPDFSMDVFVLTPEELERQKEIANTLAREVNESGVVVYG